MHGTQDISYTKDDTQLADLAIGAETTITIETKTERLKINVTIGAHRDGSTYKNEAYTTALKTPIKHEFEFQIGTRTFFDALEYQINEWVNSQFGYTKPANIPLEININTQCCIRPEAQNYIVNQSHIQVR